MSQPLSLVRRASASLILIVACTVSSGAQAPTLSTLTGRWDTKQTALRSAGTKAVWFSFKTPLFWVYTFAPDGTWTLTISQASASKPDVGRYEIKGKKILLTNGNGSRFDEWKAELKDNGNELEVQGKDLLMRLTKLPETP
jgi:hypothetical protein